MSSNLGPFSVLRAVKLTLLRRRAYDDEDEGEDIRIGHDPDEVPPAGASEFAVADDDDDEDKGDTETGQQNPKHHSDEAQTWSRRSEQEQDSGPTEADNRYQDDMDDRHVWGSKDTHHES